MKVIVTYKCEHCGYEPKSHKEALAHDCKVIPVANEGHYYIPGLIYPHEIRYRMSNGALVTYTFAQAKKKNSPK